ncbi:MAG: hypothetical protein HY286_17795, partial [Planctomycetes bacterium]|nr:hypothetical protein [Planctomycetota bacterium]
MLSNRVSVKSSLSGQFILVGVFGVLAVLAVVFFSWRRPFANDPVIEIWSDSLTSYKYTGATSVQDARPGLVGFRGARIDGSLRAGSHLPVLMAANPYESAGGSSRMGSIELSTGTLTMDDVDIALPAPGFSYVISRSYNHGQVDSGGSSRVADSPIGRNFFLGCAPEIVRYNNAGDHSKDQIVLVYGADRYIEFRRYSSTSNTYIGSNGACGSMQFTAASGGEPETYTYYDPTGHKLVFIGFDGNAGSATGQLWTLCDAAGNKAYVGDPTTASTAISNGFTATGELLKAYDSADRRISFSTSTIGSRKRYTQIKFETRSGGTWASPTGVVEVARVDYDYYPAADSNGAEGALRLVTITTPLTDSGVSSTMNKYYRYYSGTFNASTNPGHDSEIKMVVGFEAMRTYSTYLTDSDLYVKPNSQVYCEYDSNHRVSKAFFEGQCGCSGAGNGTFVYTYGSNGSYTDNAGYDTAWCTRTMVHEPQGRWTTVYFDEVGQALSRILTDDDPANTGPQPNKWCTKVTRDGSGFVTDISTPANVTGYTHSTGSFTASSSVGLVKTFTRVSSLEATGFVSDVRWKEGTSGTAYYEGLWTYDIHSVGIYHGGAAIDRNVVRFGIATSKQYFDQTSSSGSGYNETDYTITYNADSPHPTNLDLTIAKVLTTEPSVATGNNGSNSSNTTTNYYNTDGTLQFVKDEAALISYRAYTNGQVTKTIEDVDMSLTGGG